MATTRRREFLGGFGSGVLALGLGPGLFTKFGTAFGAELDRGAAGDGLDFGPLEALVRRMQETDADALLDVLVAELHGGRPLRGLVAAGALANARTHGGQDYDGYHAFMALIPALEMAERLPAEARPLPVLKVLHRDTRTILAGGGRRSERLAAVAGDSDVAVDGARLRKLERERAMEAAERGFASVAMRDTSEAFRALQPLVRDHDDVHRVVLAWRAWDMLDIAGPQHAHTLLRQSLRHCIDAEIRRVDAGKPASRIREVVPVLQERVAASGTGARRPDDARLEELGLAVFGGSGAEGAEAMAAALEEGFDPAELGEALALAGNRLLLNDPGRPRAEREKPAGSVHGASVGLHACDAARAWKSIAATLAGSERAASLIAGAYHTAGQSQRVGKERLDWQAHAEDLRAAPSAELPFALSEAVAAGDHARACAAADACGEAGLDDTAFDVLLRAALDADGALHAEKYFSTAAGEFREARPAFRRRHLLSLARVCASQAGFEAPGLERARSLLRA